MSALWSVPPAISLYHGLQLSLTVLVGCYLCIYASLQRILQLLFVALLATALLSAVYVLASPYEAIGAGGEWQGLFPHKNVLGHMMALLILKAICLLLQGWRPLLSTFAIVVATAMICCPDQVSVWSHLLLHWLRCRLRILLRTSWSAFSIAIGVLLIALSTSLFVIEFYRIDIVQYVLDVLGKDSTLTGRTLLWEFGWQAYNDGPWLGYGFKGYWESPAATTTLLRFVIGQDIWFFHNNFVDVAVPSARLDP